MKIFFVTLLFIFIFFIPYRGVFALIEGTVEQVGEEAVDAAKGVLPGVNSEEQAQTEGASDQSESLNQGLDDGQKTADCGGLNKKCCAGGNMSSKTKKPGFFRKVPLIGKYFSSVDKAVEYTDKQTNELTTGVWCQKGYPSNVNNPDLCKCIKEELTLGKMCDRIGSFPEPESNSKEEEECRKCTSHGIWTAIGCINFTLEDFFVKTLFDWGVGFAGVFSLLCIIYSAFILQTSGGSPEKIKKAKGRLTACIVGLLLIIFSVFILRVVGVDILQIPGF